MENKSEQLSNEQKIRLESTKMVLERISQYQVQKTATINTIPKMADIVSIADYKKYFIASHRDLKLNNLVELVYGQIKSGKVYGFGYENPKFSFGENGDLKREPCNCPHAPLSVVEKKALRHKAELYIENWAKAAKKWIFDGCAVVSQENTQHPQNLGVKRQIDTKDQKQLPIKTMSKKLPVVYKP